MSDSTSDVLLIGGGVTGLTTAWELSKRGVSVILVDRGAVGREASWAGAGMLPPGNPSGATTPEAVLRSYSHSHWDRLTAELVDRSGIDNEYHRGGSLELPAASASDEFDRQVEAWHWEGLRLEHLDRDSIERLIPGIHPDRQRAVFLPEFGQVRNPQHIKALREACRSNGVEIVEHCDGLRMTVTGQGTVRVGIPGRDFRSESVCLTAGAWTRGLLETIGASLPVKPIRGQMVQLRLPSLPFTCVIEEGRRYLVPRRDGLILVGSTMEDVGFEKKTTAEGVSGLIRFAESILPEFADAEIVRHWAGLRPGSPNELPFLGRMPGFSNLFVGAGHFRSGLQMSAGTGLILADLLTGQTPDISVQRFEVPSSHRSMRNS